MTILISVKQALNIWNNKKEINKETENLNNTTEQRDLTGRYRILYPTTEEYIFFSHAHGTFSRIEHM